MKTLVNKIKTIDAFTIILVAGIIAVVITAIALGLSNSETIKANL